MAINLNINLKTINGESITGTGDLVINSINWRGELVAAPSAPNDYDAYHNLNDGNTYLYFDGQWQIFSAKGEKGDEGEGLTELEIGTPIDNSTAKSILYVDEDGNLGEITNFQYDATDDSLSFLNADNVGLLLNTDVEVDDNVFLNLNGIVKMDNGAPTAFVGVTDLSIFDPSFGDGVIINSDQQVLISSDQQVLINSDQQVLINSDQQVVISSGQQVVIGSGQQVVIGTDKLLFIPENSPTLIDIQRDINSVGDNDVDMLLMKLNGATSDSVLSLRDRGGNGIFTIENQQDKRVLDWYTQPSVYGMTGDGLVMHDAYDEDSYNNGGSVVYMTNVIGDVFAPAVMTFNRDTYQRDVITFFKQDDTLIDGTVYSAGSGVDDATWDGYTIGQLFQAIKNMGFLA